MIEAPTTLTTSGQRSHSLRPSSSINNDTLSLQTVIAALCTIQKSICECCGIIGHKADACIIRGTKYPQQNLKRKINHFNAIHGDEPNEAPREWNIQPPEYHLKSSNSPSKTKPRISYQGETESSCHI